MRSESPETTEPAPAARRPEWVINLGLFIATVVSVFLTGVASDRAAFSKAAFVHGAQFTVALLVILLAHEFGHFIAARIHRVEASLPFFLPLPLLSPFGTMGAVIRMRGTIPTRKALLDIGAAGPLAGLVFAIPMYLWGVAHSTVTQPGAPDTMELGESLLLRLLDRITAPPVAVGMEIELSPVAFAAWAGMFVTLINLLPLGQLDGGHVAYALFGPKQNRYALVVHRSMLAFFFVSLVGYTMRDLQAGFGLVRLGAHVGNSLFWLFWFEVVAVLGALSTRPAAAEDKPKLGVRTRLVAIVGLAYLASVGREHSSKLLWIAWFSALAVLLAMEIHGGVLRPHTLLEHPPTGDERLGPGRTIVAIVTLLFFVLLFMPTPMAM